MQKETSFWVPGIPQPGGSKKAFRNKYTGKVIIVEDAKRNKDWRASVAQAASDHFPKPLTGAVAVRFEFFFLRPKGHFGSGRNRDQLKESSPKHHITKPDALKIARGTEDALTGIAWRDDSQITIEVIKKLYNGKTGARITIMVLDED